MSLLEDVFLNDEAGEAQELERVLEGDEYDERPQSPNSDNNSEKEDEAEEDKRRVEPNQTKPKRVVKNPRFILNPARLTGPRGIQVIPDHFKDFKFKGKGHEKEDLDLVLKKLEHWAYRLYPKFQFEDCLKKIETLGKKRPVMVHLQKIRSDQFLSEDTVVQKDSSDEEIPIPPQEEDEFDKLLRQQIELARATPAPNSARKPGFNTPNVINKSSFTMPKATSSPSINDEQRERMLRNRRLAEERRLARLKQNSTNATTSNYTNNTVIIEEETVNDDQIATNTEDTDNISKVKKHNRSHVIDSSDEESNIVTVNESVTVHIHNTNSSVDIRENVFNTHPLNGSTDVSNDKDIEMVQDEPTKDDRSNKGTESKVTHLDIEVLVASNGKATERNEFENEINIVDRNNTEIVDETDSLGTEHCKVDVVEQVATSESEELDNGVRVTKDKNKIKEKSVERDDVAAKSSVIEQSSEVNCNDDAMDLDFTDDF